MASTSERHGLMAFPRPWQVLDLRSHGFKEIRKGPSEEPRGWCRAIRSATIEIMQHCPHFVPMLWQSPLIVMPLSEETVAALYG
jgi:hypothetical protein